MNSNPPQPNPSAPTPAGPGNPAAAKRLRIFAWASFLHDMGSDMVYPIWPLFVTSFAGANMAILGLIDGLGDALVSISQAVSGYLSDKYQKRKIFIWLGYGLGALSKIGYALSPAWGWLVPFRVMDRAGKMRGAPRDAIVADDSDDHNRGRNFGVLRTMDNLGAVVGILITIALVGTLGFSHLFLLAAIPSAVATLLILWKIKESPDPAKKIFKGFNLRYLSGNFRLLLVASAIFALGSFSYSFLLVFAKTAGFHVATIPVLYLVFTAVASASALPFGKLADRVGRKTVLLISFVLWAGVSLVFLLTQNLWTIVGAFVLFGLHKGAIEPVQKAYVAELAPEAFRASSLGGFQMVVGLCALPASLLAGLLWDTVGTAMPFYLSLGLTALAGLVLAFVRTPSALPANR